MVSTDEWSRREAIFNAAKAEVDFVSDRSVAILIRKAAPPPSIGSATCIQISDILLLATAAHVIADADDSQITLVPPGRHPAGALRILSRSARGTVPQEDVAWIQISAEDAAGVGLKSLDLSHLAVCQNHESSTAFLVQGYPWESIGGDRQTGRQLEFESTSVLTLSVDPSLIAGHYKPGLDLPVEWPPHDWDDRVHKHPLPPGVSGGGMWRAPGWPTDSAVWSPDQLRLVAINRSWLRQSRILLGSRIEHWLKLVAADFPHLGGKEALTEMMAGRLQSSGGSGEGG